MPAPLYVVRGFLDPPLCRDVRAAMDRGTADAAEVLGGAMTEQADVRRAASIEIDPAVCAGIERLLDDQLPAIEAYFDIPLDGREGAGFLRYPAGGFYLPHRDHADSETWPGAARRAITLVVFLNDQGFTGGVLTVDGTDVTPAAGTLIAFPAGELHEVTVVEGGYRDSIVDWCLGAGAVAT